MEDNLQRRMVEAILEIDEEETLRLTRKALEEKIPIEKIIDGLSEGLRQMGCLFEKGERFIPELVIAAEFVNKAFKILEPHLSQKEEDKAKGWGRVKVVIATVKGDIHDLGKNLVATMLSAAGFQVIDLGKDVDAKTIVSKVKETNARVVGLSALLTTTMIHQEEVIKLLIEEGLREKVKVIIGGAPATQRWAEKIGADAYAENAMEAVRKLKEIFGES
ncbi:MAG: corrinoid protein [Candidatus Jordarchaeaceae archaeon]